MQNNRQSEAKKLDNCVATAVSKKNVNQTSSSSSSSTTGIQSSSANSNNNCSSGTTNKSSNKNGNNAVLTTTTQQNNNAKNASNNNSSNNAKSKSNAAAQIIANSQQNNASGTSPQNSTPTKSDTETYSEFQRRVTDSSDSDEESVSEVIFHIFHFLLFPEHLLYITISCVLSGKMCSC